MFTSLNLNWFNDKSFGTQVGLSERTTAQQYQAQYSIRLIFSQISSPCTGLDLNLSDCSVILAIQMKSEQQQKKHQWEVFANRKETLSFSRTRMCM